MSHWHGVACPLGRWPCAATPGQPPVWCATQALEATMGGPTQAAGGGLLMCHQWCATGPSGTGGHNGQQQQSGWHCVGLVAQAQVSVCGHLTVTLALVATVASSNRVAGHVWAHCGKGVRQQPWLLWPPKVPGASKAAGTGWPMIAVPKPKITVAMRPKISFIVSQII